MAPEQTIRLIFLIAGIDDMADIVKSGKPELCSDLPGKIKSYTNEIAKTLALNEELMLINLLEK